MKKSNKTGQNFKDIVMPVEFTQNVSHGKVIVYSRYKKYIDFFKDNKISLYYRWLDQNGDRQKTYVKSEWINFTEEEIWCCGLPLTAEFPSEAAYAKFKLKFCS